MCDGGSELGGGKVVVQTLPRGDSHSAVPSAHQGQQKVTVKVSGKAASAARGRSGAASGHIWLLFSTSTDLIVGLQRVTLFKQNTQLRF